MCLDLFGFWMGCWFCDLVGWGGFVLLFACWVFCLRLVGCGFLVVWVGGFGIGVLFVVGLWVCGLVF